MLAAKVTPARPANRAAIDAKAVHADRVMVTIAGDRPLANAAGAMTATDVGVVGAAATSARRASSASSTHSIPSSIAVSRTLRKNPARVG